MWQIQEQWEYEEKKEALMKKKPQRERAVERDGMRDRGGQGIVVCQRLMLSHEDRSTPGLNVALPALGACGVMVAC